MKLSPRKVEPDFINRWFTDALVLWQKNWLVMALLSLVILSPAILYSALPRQIPVIYEAVCVIVSGVLYLALGVMAVRTKNASAKVSSVPDAISLAVSLFKANPKTMFAWKGFFLFMGLSATFSAPMLIAANFGGSKVLQEWLLKPPGVAEVHSLVSAILVFNVALTFATSLIPVHPLFRVFFCSYGVDGAKEQEIAFTSAIAMNRTVFVKMTRTYAICCLGYVLVQLVAPLATIPVVVAMLSFSANFSMVLFMDMFGDDSPLKETRQSLVPTPAA